MFLDIKILPLLESLDIGGISLNLVVESSVLSAEIEQSVISYNFTTLYTPKNARLLNLPAEIESPDSFEEFDVLILIQNSIEIEATLTIQEANSSFIKLKIESKDFDTSFLSDNLNTFDYEGDIDIGPNTSNVVDHVLDANTKDYPDTTHVFPMINNEDFYEDENSEYLGVINNYDIVADDLVANTDGPVKNKNVLVPYFFLIHIFKQIFENNGITLKGTFIDDVEAQKVLVHNNYALDEFDIEQIFVRSSITSDVGVAAPWVSSKNDRTFVFDDDSTFPNEDNDTIYNTGTGAFTVSQTGILNINLFNLGVTMFCSSSTSIWRFYIEVEIDGVIRSSWNNWDDGNQHLVYFGRKDFNQITLPGINLTASDLTKTGYIKFGFLYCDQPPSGYDVATIHDGVITEINFEKWTDYNVYSKTINPANHLPNLSAKDFINKFIKGFRLMPYFDKVKRELYFSYFNDIFIGTNYDDLTSHISSNTIKSVTNTGFKVNYVLESDVLFPENQPDVTRFQYVGEYDTIDDLPTPASVSLMAYVKSVNAYYVSMVVSGIEFVRFKEGVDDFLIGDGSVDYLIDYSPFLMDNVEIDNDGAATIREFLLPKISETGSSLFYGIGINEPLFKVLIWHGMVDGPTASKPYPFASSYNIDQNGNEISDLTFKLSDEDYSVYTLYLKNYFNFLLNTKKVEHVYTSNLPHPLSYNFHKKKLIINQRFLTGKLKLKITSNGFESIVAENYKI
jgi:hypothetical protein